MSGISDIESLRIVLGYREANHILHCYFPEVDNIDKMFDEGKKRKLYQLLSKINNFMNGYRFGNYLPEYAPYDEVSFSQKDIVPWKVIIKLSLIYDAHLVDFFRHNLSIFDREEEGEQRIGIGLQAQRIRTWIKENPDQVLTVLNSCDKDRMPPEIRRITLLLPHTIHDVLEAQLRNPSQE